MKTEYDFSQGERGKFFRPNASFRLPTTYEEPTSNVQLIMRENQPSKSAFSLNSFAESGLSAHT